MLVNGTIGNALVSSSGTGSVYLLGTNTSVRVDLAGVSSVYLRNANRKSTYLLLLWLHDGMLQIQLRYYCCHEAVDSRKIVYQLRFGNDIEGWHDRHRQFAMKHDLSF